MNKFIGIGYIGKKGVELKYTESGKAVATFSLSIPRQFSDKKEYDFLNTVAWGKTAEFMANNSSKIKKVAVEGRIQTRSWEGKDGHKNYATELVAENVEVTEWNNEGQAQNNGFQPVDGFMPIEDDDSPF